MTAQLAQEPEDMNAQEAAARRAAEAAIEQARAQQLIDSVAVVEPQTSLTPEAEEPSSDPSDGPRENAA